MSDSWLERSVLVTVGTGGVGKTTTAAALGLEAALRGRRVLVLTVDPARRLAQALSLQGLCAEPQRVPLHSSRGGLDVMMLDTRRVFDRLVGRLAPDDGARDRILSSPLYAQLADSLSGTREYAALEQLAELHASRRYDLVVLDTPPSTHAAELLDAPRRLEGFLDGGFLRAIAEPQLALARGGLRLLRVGSDLALASLERLTGLTFVKELAELLRSFESLLGGMRERALAVSRLLRSEACGFVLVAGPDSEQVERALSFHARLVREEIALAGLVVNRLRAWPARPIPARGQRTCERARRWLAAELDPVLAEQVVAVARQQAQLAERDARAAARLERRLALPRACMRRVPLLGEADAWGPELDGMRTYLFGRGAVGLGIAADGGPSSGMPPSSH